MLPQEGDGILSAVTSTSFGFQLRCTGTSADHIMFVFLAMQPARVFPTCAWIETLQKVFSPQGRVLVG